MVFRKENMKAAIVVLFVLVILALLFCVAIMLFVILRLEEYDRFLEEHKVNVENLRQGGQMQLKRIHRLEDKLGITPE